MKKTLNEEAIVNELHGNSLFFPTTSEISQPVQKTPQAPQSEAISQQPSGVIPRYHDTKRDTTIPRHHDTDLETIRRAVKQFGKEAATHRFTSEEKRELKNIEHDYLAKNIRTSENEITRIAINYILEDYKSNGKKSILAQVLDLLNS